MLTLEMVKNYLRVEYEEDNEYLKMLMEVAYAYMVDAISFFDEKYQVREGEKPLSKQKEHFIHQSNLVMLTLIQGMYDERYMFGQRLEPNYIVRSLLFQLQMEEQHV